LAIGRGEKVEQLGHFYQLVAPRDIGEKASYYLPRPVSATDLAVMHRMDELHLDFPFAGSRMLRDLLNADGVEIGFIRSVAHARASRSAFSSHCSRRRVAPIPRRSTYQIDGKLLRTGAANFSASGLKGGFRLI
jgi:hypothetical protein